MVSAARSGFVTYEMRDAEAAIACATRALQILPEDELYWRAVAANCLAGAYKIHGDIQLARQALAKNSIINRGTSNNYSILVQHWREACL